MHGRVYVQGIKRTNVFVLIERHHAADSADTTISLFVLKRSREKFSIQYLCLHPNLVPRSHSVTGNVRSGKVRFRACSVPARPEIRAFLSLRMFVLSVVILGDFAE